MRFLHVYLEPPQKKKKKTRPYFSHTPTAVPSCQLRPSTISVARGEYIAHDVQAGLRLFQHTVLRRYCVQLKHIEWEYVSTTRPTGRVVCRKIFFNLIGTIVCFTSLLFWAVLPPSSLIMANFVQHREMVPANCIILEVLENDRYNISVTPLYNNFSPYSTISEALKEGFKDFQRGQKLKCFFSEDYHHGYVKWQVQFHSETKDISFLSWTEPVLLLGIAVCVIVVSVPLLLFDTSCSAGFFLIAIALIFFGIPISFVLRGFMYKEKLSEARCTILELLSKDRCKVSVASVVSIIKPFTLIEKAAKEGFDDFQKGQKLPCYYTVGCVRKSDYYYFECAVQFHKQLKAFAWYWYSKLGLLLVCLPLIYCICTFMYFCLSLCVKRCRFENVCSTERSIGSSASVTPRDSLPDFIESATENGKLILVNARKRTTAASNV